MACGTAGAQVEVRSPAAKLLDTTPGKIITTSVVVTNRGTEADEFVERFTLPADCQRVAPAELPFRLEPGAQTVRVLAVQVPATMPAGRFPMRYLVQGRRDPSAIGSTDMEIQVVPVDNLELVVEPRTEPVFAGDNYPVRIRVTNHGNTRLPVRLAWRSSMGYRVTGGVPAFDLEAGASREILFRVETDNKLAQRTGHAVSFEASATSASGKELTERRSALAEVIPLVTGNRDPFHRIPMRLTLSALAETDREAMMQMELSGAGSLDEAGRHRINFLFRGPDMESKSFLGDRDEYGFTYQNDHWEVNLGDRLYTLSPLTERYGFGRGAGVNYRSGAITAGAFYMTTLHRQRNTEEIGAYVRHQAGNFSVQGNFLRKWGGTSELFSVRALPQNIYTVEGRYQRGKALDIRLEGGLGRSDSGKTDFGFRAEARGEIFGKVQYSVEHVHAGPNFNGYESDTRSTYASVTAPLSKKFRVRASLADYAGNLDLNPERSQVVNRETSWSAGITYALGKKTDVSIDAKHLERTDILQPAAYDFVEDSTRLSVAHNFGKLMMTSAVDLGTLDNQLTRWSGEFQRYSGSVSFHPTAKQSYSLSGSYGPSSFTAAADNLLSVNASAQWQIKDSITASVNYARNQYDNLEGQEMDQAMVAARYRRPNNDEISLLGRWSRMGSNEDRHEAALLLSYSRPLSVAVSRKTSIGTLRGRLTVGGVGVARAVIKAGEAFAVTDSVGEFEFPALKPGGCDLRVVSDSLGPALVVSTPLPMKVKIRGGETTRVELSAVKAASISVRLNVFDFASRSITSTDVKAAGGWESANVELTNGHDVLRAQTDRLGALSFERVPCGRWKLRIADERVPAQHFIEQPEHEFELAAGDTKRIDVRVMPRRRTIKMIDQGAVR